MSERRGVYERIKTRLLGPLTCKGCFWDGPCADNPYTCDRPKHYQIRANEVRE